MLEHELRLAPSSLAPKTPNMGGGLTGRLLETKASRPSRLSRQLFLRERGHRPRYTRGVTLSRGAPTHQPEGPPRSRKCC
eukprot:scaffold17995_cov106-Isochrysis_galbana.AAC.1